MSRLPFIEADRTDPKLQAVLKGTPPLNLFRVLPHAGPAALGFLALGSSLLRESALDARLRELVILRVGELSQASYEIHQHRQVARLVGVPEAQIAAIRQGPGDPAFDEWETLVLAFTDAVVHDVKAPVELYDALAARLDDRRMAELVMTIGYYMMVSRFLENFEVDIESTEAIAPENARRAGQ